MVREYLNGGTWSLRILYTPSDFFSKYFRTSSKQAQNISGQAQKSSEHLRTSLENLKTSLGIY
jgi:hypothetical protein